MTLSSRVFRWAVVGSMAVAGSLVVAPGMAGAAPRQTSASSHALGTAGTAGPVAQPQPFSPADSNNTGANSTSASNQYRSTRNGAASLNGSGTGLASGKPCAGCVGKADNKNPPGQFPNGSDPNAGYECDRNQGIGQSNPAHTGCADGIREPAPPCTGANCAPPPPPPGPNCATSGAPCRNTPPGCVESGTTLCTSGPTTCTAMSASSRTACLTSVSLSASARAAAASEGLPATGVISTPPTAATAPASSRVGSLAFTGRDVGGEIGLAALLLLTGTAGLAWTRRRRANGLTS